MKKELLEIAKRLKKESRKGKKLAIVMTVTTHHLSTNLCLFPTRYVQDFICIPISIRNIVYGNKLIKEFDGKVDAFFVDAENKLSSCIDLHYKLSKIIKKSKLYPLKGNDFTADSAYAIIFNLLGSLKHKRVFIVGSGNIGSKVALKLLESGAAVFVLNSNKKSTNQVARAINILKPKECQNKMIPVSKNNFPKKIDCIIGFSRGIPIITNEMVRLVNKNGHVIDGGLGTLEPDAMSGFKKRKINIMKLDIRYGFESNASLMLNSDKLVSKIAGQKKIKNFSIVAGGIIGNYGDVIVDDIAKPTKIFGISDGRGGILKEQSKFKTNIKIIQKKLKR